MNRSEVPLLGRVISPLSSLLVVALAIGAFALSFEALRDLAAKHGVAPEKAWLWPSILDGSIIVFSLAALRSQIFGRRANYEMALVFGATAASCAFNIIHAPEDMVSRFMAVVPPFCLFLAFEVLIRQLRSDNEDRLALSEGDKTTVGEGDKTPVQSSKRQRLSKQDKIDRRKADVAALKGDGMTAEKIAKKLDVSLRTVRRDLKDMNLEDVEEEGLPG
jgi:hypothetical protein